MQGMWQDEFSQDLVRQCQVSSSAHFTAHARSDASPGASFSNCESVRGHEVCSSIGHSLLYSDVLVPRDLCEHSQSTDKSASFTQFVRDQSNVFTLSVDSISVLDTRLPKLQVGPNVAKRKAGKGNALLAVEGLFSKDHISRDHIELLSEIQRVSNAFRFRIEALVRS